MTRQYWKSMQYACDKCGYIIIFNLEYGCEGPYGGSDESFTLPVDHPYDPGKTIQWPRTPSGRLTVPVPFVAGGCPKCQGPQPWNFDGGVMRHINWRQDVVFQHPLHELAPDRGCFHYPPDPKDMKDGQWKCGIPMFPGKVNV